MQTHEAGHSSPCCRLEFPSVRRLVRHLTLFSLLVPLLLSATACSLLRRGEGNQTLGTEVSLVGEATLLCSQECADRGQCGSAEQGEMVLLSSSGPVTIGHNMAIPHGTTVTIDREEVRPVVQVSNNEPFSLSYYLVNVPDRGPGWVAGWCIGQ